MMRLLCCVFLAAACVTSIACSKPTLEDKIQTFIDESGLTFEDCGDHIASNNCTEGDPPPEVACFLDALAACEPARLDVTQHTIEGDPIYSTFFVVPLGDFCEVEYFFDNRADEFGSGELTQSTCAQAGPGASCIQPVAVDECSSDCGSDTDCG